MEKPARQREWPRKSTKDAQPQDLLRILRRFAAIALSAILQTALQRRRKAWRRRVVHFGLTRFDWVRLSATECDWVRPDSPIGLTKELEITEMIMEINDLRGLALPHWPLATNHCPLFPGPAISKNRRVCAAQIAYYHALVGLQAQIFTFFRRPFFLPDTDFSDGFVPPRGKRVVSG